LKLKINKKKHLTFSSSLVNMLWKCGFKPALRFCLQVWRKKDPTFSERRLLKNSFFFIISNLEEFKNCIGRWFLRVL
jgi:hypothetical protein